MTRGCSIPGCERPHYAKGYCNTHWARSRRGHVLDRPFRRSEWPWADRFWAKVDRRGPDECWLWKASQTKGYGAFGCAGRQTYAHRASYVLAHGEILAGMFVCHRCDTPLCVNPAHLFLGTNADNVADCVAKGRNPKGDRLPWAKLRSPDVPNIRARLANGECHDAIAADYGVSRATISLINTGKTWRAA